MSTFSLVGSRSPNGMRMCVCVDGMNLKYALLWHIHRSVYSVLCQYYNLYTQAHAHTPQTISALLEVKPFEDSEPTGLKVDIADGCTLV